METLVPGRMPRAGFLLLPLLLCFVPETAGSINPDALRVIVDHVDRAGFSVEYDFAISLHRTYCQTPSDLEAVLPRRKLGDMQRAISGGDRLYDPDQGNIVAAAVTELPNTRWAHAEWRLLQGGRNSPVSKLLARTSRENNNNICLIFFTLSSPCVGKCLLVNRRHNILRMVSDTFRHIDNNYKAFVFQRIFWWDRDNETRESLLQAWHQLQNVPLYRCDNNGCRDCSGNNPNTNACLDGMRAMEQPLLPPGRG